MSEPGLVPGDRVVDLAGLVRTCAVLTAAIASAACLWILTHSALKTLGAVVSGGAAGFLFGSLLGAACFPARAGCIKVVKLGPGALDMALKAGMNGGAIPGILAGIVLAMAFDASRILLLAATGGSIGMAIGVGSAYLATRP